MRFLSSAVVLPLLLAPLTLAAKGAAKDRFTEASSKSFPIKLDDDKLSALVSGRRDYSTVVLLTAMDPKFGCGACQEFGPEWDLLARSWQKGDKQQKLRTLFTTLDFADGRATFQSLNLQHAPVLLLYPAVEGPNAKPGASTFRYDFTGSASAEMIHAWIARHVPDGPAPPVVRPFNYVRAVLLTTSALGVITLFTVAAPHLMPIIQNRNVWAAISLLSVLLFTSGHMFNHIRKVPYVQGDGRGGVSYFAGGFQNQFGLETQIIAGIYGILAFACINLALKCPRITDPKTQQVAVLAWCGGLFFVYSFLLSIFRFKNGGYPFYLPPF